MSEKVFLSKLQEHQRIIYKLVHLYAVDEEDKKDLYQEIVLQARKAFPRFRGESAFSTWLYRLCLNTIFTLKRKVNRVEYTDTLQYEDRPTDAAHNDDAELLYTAIRTLNEADRAIISMHLDGYSNAEIADCMGLSLNSVGVRLHRIKQQLATILKKV